MMRPALLTAVVCLVVAPAAAQDLDKHFAKGGTEADLVEEPEVAEDPSGIDFGDDMSQWSDDGECDDRRFFGPGTSMDSGFLTEDIGHDATDCRTLLNTGQITLWVEADARAATQCTAIDFGDDTSEWANDGECDDMRFEGSGTATDLVPEDTQRDATDCRAACEAGTIFLRDY